MEKIAFLMVLTVIVDKKRRNGTSMAMYCRANRKRCGYEANGTNNDRDGVRRGSALSFVRSFALLTRHNPSSFGRLSKFTSLRLRHSV